MDKESPQQPSFENPKIQNFLINHEINPEDFAIIRELIDLTNEFQGKNNLIAHFHNYFDITRLKKDAVDKLEIDIKAVQSDVKLFKKQNRDVELIKLVERILKFRELFLKLVNTYDHSTVYSLERILERL